MLYGDDWEDSDYEDKLPKGELKAPRNPFGGPADIPKHVNFVQDHSATVKPDVSGEDRSRVIFKQSTKTKKKQVEEELNKRNMKAVSKKSKVDLEQKLETNYGSKALKML
jgi:hypothetical protein